MPLDCFDGECVYCDCEESDKNITENQKNDYDFAYFYRESDQNGNKPESITDLSANVVFEFPLPGDVPKGFSYQSYVWNSQETNTGRIVVLNSGIYLINFRVLVPADGAYAFQLFIGEETQINKKYISTNSSNSSTTFSNIILDTHVLSLKSNTTLELRSIINAQFKIASIEVENNIKPLPVVFKIVKLGNDALN